MTREQKTARLSKIGFPDPEKNVDAVDFHMLLKKVLQHPEAVMPAAVRKH